MKRIENGHISYTVLENDSLVATFWLIPVCSRSGELNDSSELQFIGNCLAFSYYKSSFLPELLKFLRYVLQEMNYNFEEKSAIRFQISENQKNLRKIWNKNESTF